jgi:hypothetical protein
LSFCSSWLHLLKDWSLRSTRSGSSFILAVALAATILQVTGL